METDTGFWLYHTDSELRRKGRMTRHPRRRRAEFDEKLGRPDPQSIGKDVQHLLEVVLQKTDRVVLRRDEHRSYPPAIGRVRCRVRHEVTNSKEPRTSRNPLFPVRCASKNVHGPPLA